MPRPTLEARRATGPITLDGTLNELAWSLADSTRGTFYQSIPDQGAPATERTVVRVLYDDERLYVGAVMYDSRPDLLVSAGMEQDFATQDSDIFGFALDTYLDRQNAFLFAVNPAGALFDAQAFNDQQSVNRAWEGEVEVSTRITDEGWVAEVAVPLTTLRFRATEGAQSWGLNFARRIRRISEDSQWAPLTRQFRIYKMSRAGTLTSLEGLRQGRNLWVKPFVNGVRTDGAQAASQGEAVEGGFDLKWGITPQFTLDFTALTDFSQVEVDEQQINLTRFSLFFPEKRDFFLENEGIFAFQDARVRNFRTGSGPQNFKLFHSRRIGLSAERTPVPIAGGVRLTGRAGGYAVGLLNMQTRDKGGSPAENSSVVRLRKNVLGSSDIGVMFVNRAGTGPEVAGDYNRSFGADANLRLAGGRMLLNTYLALTDEPGADGDRTAGLLEVAWRDPLWDASMLLKTVGDDFNPGVGFVARRGVRQGFVTLGAHPQPDIPRVRELNPYVDIDLYSDLKWALETREITPGLGVSFLDSGILTLEYAVSYERLAAETRIAGASVPAGEYDFGAFTASYQSNLGRKVGGKLSITQGGFFDGERTSVGGSVTIRPSARLFVEGTAQRNRLTLAGRTFEANLFGGRVRLARDTRTFLSAFVQYNESADELQTNIRFNLIHAPLSDLFLVYSERRNPAPEAGEAGLIDRAITVKFTKLLAF
ncbi:MAG: carbohydrate binding family 9 domain-containing protein [Gemmatimonadetes bacterium]|nr:carbohydrate binding family 9 domain-containing protein [Gemmatimonadota bacterium]MYE71468.1 carbohydrate binding family 9 domain-containing protein [Gemmatimonadota bacterium]